MKSIINYLFDRHQAKIAKLSAERPLLKPYLLGLTQRFEQNNEPPPTDTESVSEMP